MNTLNPTKAIGLDIYGNTHKQTKLMKEYGQSFVDACLSLAITVIPPVKQKYKRQTCIAHDVSRGAAMKGIVMNNQLRKHRKK